MPEAGVHWDRDVAPKLSLLDLPDVASFHLSFAATGMPTVVVSLGTATSFWLPRMFGGLLVHHYTGWVGRRDAWGKFVTIDEVLRSTFRYWGAPKYGEWP